MAHLSSFGVSNFRVFKNYENFKLGPVTILTGTNSSGKSSFVKAILSVIYNFKSNSYEPSKYSNISVNDLSLWSIENIQFDSDLNLGNFETVKNWHNKSNLISYDLPFKFPGLDTLFTLRLQYKQDASKLKALELNKLIIFNKNANNHLICYENKDLTIKFSNLYELYKESVNFYEEKHQLKSEIERLINLFGLNDESDFSKHPDIKSLYEQYKQLPKVNESNFELRNHNLKSSSIYFSEPVHLYNRKGWPLLDYIFLFEEEHLYDYKDVLFKGMRDEDKLERIEEIIRLKNELDEVANENGFDTLKDLILNEELKLLNDLKFKAVTKDAESFEQALDRVEKNLLKHVFGPKELFNITLNPQDQLIRLLIKSDSILKNYLSNDLIVKPNIMAEILKVEPQLYFNNKVAFIGEFIVNGIKNMFKTYYRISKNIHYIPSVRARTERYYKTSSAESFLHSTLSNINRNDILNREEKNTEAKNFLKRHLELFKIDGELDIDVSKDSVFSEIIFKKDNKVVNLADLGYGVSQLLPILLYIAFLINNRTTDDDYDPIIVIIEEPETNLHPAHQSKLADMFVECFEKYNIQFIIETHSEYLIRKLQYLTAKKIVEPDFTQIYYFYPPDEIPEGKQVNKININANGSLTDDFGTGFFDESDKIAISLFNLQHSQNN